VQASSPADDECLRGQGRPAGQYQPVFAGLLKTVAVEQADREPVVVGAVATVEGGPGAADRKGFDAGDVVVPAGELAFTDAHDREVGVVAGPGCGSVDVQCVAVADAAIWVVSGGIAPDGLEIYGETRQPTSAERRRASGSAPAVVPVDAFVEIPDPWRSAPRAGEC